MSSIDLSGSFSFSEEEEEKFKDWVIFWLRKSTEVLALREPLLLLILLVLKIY